MKSVDKVLITIDREIEPPVTKSEGFDFLCELLEEIHNRIEAIREDAIAGESGGDETLRAPVGARTRSSTTNVRSLIGSAFRGGDWPRWGGGHRFQDAGAPNLSACCAQIVHVTAAPPRSVMNSRRLMCPVPWLWRSLSCWLAAHYGIAEGPARSLGQTDRETAPDR